MIGKIKNKKFNISKNRFFRGNIWPRRAYATQGTDESAMPGGVGFLLQIQVA